MPAVIHGSVTRTETEPVRLDASTHAMIGITYAHHEIHSGTHFVYADAKDIANAATESFTLTVADSKAWPHLTFNVNGQAELGIDIYEGATPDTPGTVVSGPAVINRNRNSGNANTMIIKDGPAIGAGSKGTLILRTHAGSGKAGQGDVRGQAELVLKQNTMYWIDVINATTSDNFISWVADWYEHTDRD